MLVLPKDEQHDDQDHEQLAHTQTEWHELGYSMKTPAVP
jgi:hypothetical protein